MRAGLGAFLCYIPSCRFPPHAVAATVQPKVRDATKRKAHRSRLLELPKIAVAIGWQQLPCGFTGFGLHLSIPVCPEIANAAKATALYGRGWLNCLRSSELVRHAFGFRLDSRRYRMRRHTKRCSQKSRRGPPAFATRKRCGRVFALPAWAREHFEARLS
jgi:hypothetical protein